jgi:hypothetical protein
MWRSLIAVMQAYVRKHDDAYFKARAVEAIKRSELQRRFLKYLK